MALGDYDGRRPEPPYNNATDRSTALSDAIQACESEMVATPDNADDETYNRAISHCIEAIKGLA